MRAERAIEEARGRISKIQIRIKVEQSNEERIANELAEKEEALCDLLEIASVEEADARIAEIEEELDRERRALELTLSELEEVLDFEEAD